MTNPESKAHIGRPKRWFRKFRFQLPVAVLILCVATMYGLRSGCSIPARLGASLSADPNPGAGFVRMPPNAKPELMPGEDNHTEVQSAIPGTYVAQSYFIDPNAIGGFGQGGRPFLPLPRNFDGRGCYLVAEPEVKLEGEQWRGMRVSLVNATWITRRFDASDSALYLVQEAQDELGHWRAIEQTPVAWCGNSLHRIFLPPHHYWDWAALRYSGPFSTRLRFRLNTALNITLYSNEFEGSVNPTQFLPDDH